MSTIPEPNPAPAVPVLVVYEIVYTDALLVTLWQRLCRARRSWLFMQIFRAGASLLVAALLGLVLWLDRATRWGLGSVLFAFLLIVVFSARIDQWLAVRRWQRSPLWNSRARVELTADGARSANQQTEARSRWRAFTSARRFPDGFLLFAGPGLAYWLPDKEMTHGTAEEAARLIAGAMVDYKER